MNTQTILHTFLLLIIAFAVIMGFFVTHKVALDVDLSTRSKDTITVTGRAEKSLTPDTARISFYVTKRNKDQHVAGNYVNKITKQVISAMIGLGIEEGDIKTTNYSIEPKYSWSKGRKEFQNYRARQSVAVTIHNLDKSSEIIQKLTELRVDNISGPNMFIDDIEKKRDLLRKEAIADARKKAQELAIDLGVHISKIVGYSEEGNNNYRPTRVLMDKALRFESGLDNKMVEAPEIMPGEQKISKTVQLIFKIGQ
jgi:uncharacterized protein YggE